LIHPVIEREIPDSDDGTQYFTSVPFHMTIESKPLVAGGALTPQGLALQHSLARLCAPTVFIPEDADCLLNPDSIPTGDDLLSALASLEAAPYTVTPEQIEAQYDFERQETEESVDKLRDKVRQVAALLRESDYCVVYTGAGISTSADIPDFRGPTGVWTLKDKGLAWTSHKTILEVKPTYAHYAITELAKRGMVKFIVTTNVDGLHWRTGLPDPLLEELHGSLFTELCPRCRQLFRRQFVVYGVGGADHITGRKCEWCGEALVDTMVAFCESYRSDLEPVVTEFHARRADMALVLGTSMCVQSCAMYPMAVVEDGNLVLVNLQRTPVDDLASVRCFCKTDLFCQMLMQELGITEFDRQTDLLSKKRKK
jgi:NAD-dependent SIR2 family protein deacetylase